MDESHQNAAVFDFEISCGRASWCGSVNVWRLTAVLVTRITHNHPRYTNPYTHKDADHTDVASVSLSAGDAQRIIFISLSPLTTPFFFSIFLKVTALVK